MEPTLTDGGGRALWAGLRPGELVAMGVAATLVLAASVFRWWSISTTEALGFATGGICVWLVVREHMWNWPIGLANNAVFFVLFFQSRLYADMGLQVLYLGLGVFGWVVWLRGAKGSDAMPISRTTGKEWIALALGIPVATWALRAGLIAVSGAAPFWDSLTTVISLAAQYLLCRKRFENWYLWIAADLVYVPLYLARSLPLTATLYAGFLVMCVLGLREWTRSPHWRRNAA